MSYILTYARVALTTSDVQSTLEIPATDEIHMEDRNHGLAWTPGLNLAEQWQNATQPTDLRVKSYINPVVPDVLERSKEE